MMESIGSIKDTTGRSYDVRYWASKTNDRTHYDMAAYDGNTQIGEFEFDSFDDDKYVYVDMIEIEEEYRHKGLYLELLKLVHDFFKAKGFEALYSKGKLRNANADKVWDKIPNKKTKMDGPYKDYIFESMRHIKSFRLFEAEMAQAAEQDVKTWIGNSKVSKNGKPLIVYHGTSAKFDKFDKSWMGQTDEGYYGRGFYFTGDREYAKEFGSNVIEAYLKIENPFYIRTWSTLGSWIEIELRDDLAKLKGVPSFFKTNREVPKGYELRRQETDHHSQGKIVEYQVVPKPELYGTDKEIYGPEVKVTRDEAVRGKNDEGYSQLAIVQFNDMLNDVDFDGGLANWVLQKLDRYNFHETLQKNGYDGIFVVGADGSDTPIEEVSEFVVWEAENIMIKK